jgi:hypothetical protein
MTLEARVRQDGTNVSVEVHALDRGLRRGYRCSPGSAE